MGDDDHAAGFVPPPYPYERLDALKRLADSLPGGVVDCSIGTPCDPVPEVAAHAAAAALPSSMGYPASAGSAVVARRRGRVDRAAVRRRGRRATNVGACIGTKEFVASLPHLLRLRTPAARHRALSGGRLPDLRDGRDPRRLPGRSRPARRRVAPRSRRDRRGRRRARACCSGSTSPATPRRRSATPRRSRAIAAWARARGIVVASDECYVEFAPEPATILAAGLDGVLAVHSLSKRSNLAGMRVRLLRRRPRARRPTSSRRASTRASWCRRRCRPRRSPRSATTTTSPSNGRATRNAASS